MATPRSRRRRDEAGERVAPAGARGRNTGMTWPPAPALAVVFAWALVYALAPPARNVCWAVNGLRSVPAAVAAAVVLAAIGATFLPFVERNGRGVAIGLGALIAATLAGPLRQHLHLLGDSSTRLGAIWNYSQGLEPRSLGYWSTVFHAQPLDLLTGLVVPAWITRATGSRDVGVGVVSAVLAAIYLAGAWRLVGRISPPRSPALALWMALAAWGGLEAFAGYAESAGVLLASAVWWWVALFSPLRTSRAAFLLALALAGVFASHRLGLVLAAPQLVRVLGPPLEGDEPGARRTAFLGTVAVLVAALSLQWAYGGTRLGSDVGELLRWPEADALAMVPTDLLNLAVLMAPLALLAGLLCGREALGAAARDRRAPVLLCAAVLLLPTAFPMPVAPSGLGLPRDWDLSALLGLTLTIGGALVFAHLPQVRLRPALIVALPLLLLGTGGWIVVSAGEEAGVRRAYALLEDTPRLGASQASGVEFMLGDYAVETDRMAEAARLLESSWRHVPSPARGLHAARAWLYAGNPAAARRMLEAVRSHRDLPPARVLEADSLESYVRLLEASARPGR